METVRYYLVRIIEMYDGRETTVHSMFSVRFSKDAEISDEKQVYDHLLNWQGGVNRDGICRETPDSWCLSRAWFGPNSAEVAWRLDGYRLLDREEYQRTYYLLYAPAGDDLNIQRPAGSPDLTDLLEDSYSIASILSNLEAEEHPKLVRGIKEQGTGFMWELHKDMVTKFRADYRDTAWGWEEDWHDSLESFVERYLKTLP